ncbi:MAG: hypothetical protein OEU50_17495 [Gammaproteobacteria bacterium]|nr:hypothetical protein [Gammaproteobacteria bacterium]
MDLTSVLCGPFYSWLLSTPGAGAIKVEIDRLETWRNRASPRPASLRGGTCRCRSRR